MSHSGPRMRGEGEVPSILELQSPARGRNEESFVDTEAWRGQRLEKPKRTEHIIISHGLRFGEDVVACSR